MKNDIHSAMDEFYKILQRKSSTEAPAELIYAASLLPRDTAISALSRLLVIVHTRGECDRARLEALETEGAFK